MHIFNNLLPIQLKVDTVGDEIQHHVAVGFEDAVVEGEVLVCYDLVNEKRVLLGVL